MSEPEPTERCVVCATTEGPFEQHHVTLRANCATATVPVCRGACHDEQTDRQRRAGLIDPRTNRASGLDPAIAMLQALTEGVAGIFVASARTLGDKRLCRVIERDRRATMRLLALILDGRSGTLGGRPISNERHGAGKLGQSRRAPAVTPSATESLHALADVFPALAAAISDALPGDVGLLPGFTVDELCAMLRSAGSGIARNLAALESHPRAGELAGAIERDHDTTLAALQALATATAPDALGDPGKIDPTRPARLVRDFRALAERWTGLLAALTTSEPADADAALTRFIDGQDREADHARRLAA